MKREMRRRNKRRAMRGGGGGRGQSGGVGKAQAKKDPMGAVRRALDDEAYDPMRLVLAASGEGPLAAYAFDPPPPRAVKKMDEVKGKK